MPATPSLPRSKSSFHPQLHFLMEGVRSSRRQARHSRARRSYQKRGSGERDSRMRSYSGFGSAISTSKLLP
ncbi:hypothetical protein S245_043902 [Arachis hypogaea]